MARYDEQDLIDRAARAFSTRQRRAGCAIQQPSAASSRTEEYAGRVFAVLENTNGVMAVYKLKDDGHLEYVRKENWPAALRLEQEAECVNGSLNIDVGSHAAPFPGFLKKQLDRSAEGARQKSRR